MKEQKVMALSKREHLLLHPGMYIGSCALTERQDIVDQKAGTFEVVPALLKIIDEVIDNCVDEHIRTNEKYATAISIDINTKDNTILVQDNGRGIPITMTEDENGNRMPMAVLAWTELLAGGNFETEERMTGGMHGIGSAATNIASASFEATSYPLDTLKFLELWCSENRSEIKWNVYSRTQVGKTLKHGTVVKFTPDKKLFDGYGVGDLDHVAIIRESIKQRAIQYSKIRFDVLIDGERVTYHFNSAKALKNEFGEEAYIQKNGNCTIIVAEAKDLDQLSWVNNIRPLDGGMHIQLIKYELMTEIRDHIKKKHKLEVKPRQISGNMFVAAFMHNFPNSKFSGQTKEKLSNTATEVQAYFKDNGVRFDLMSANLIKNEGFINRIVEELLLRRKLEEERHRKLLAKEKKFSSDKYYPAINKKKYLMICEGESAVAGLKPALGRDNIGYYELKGVPLNVIKNPSMFQKNKELPELYKIIINEEYDYVIMAGDADLDGIHIKGLLLGFFQSFFEDMLDGGRVGHLLTPVFVVKKKNKIVDWYYNISDSAKARKANPTGSITYYKGLGTWQSKDLKYIVEKDGLTNMIDILDTADTDIIDVWLDGDRVADRKKLILENQFSLVKL